jgi:hypothetical protein
MTRSMHIQRIFLQGQEAGEEASSAFTHPQLASPAPAAVTLAQTQEIAPQSSRLGALSDALTPVSLLSSYHGHTIHVEAPTPAHRRARTAHGMPWRPNSVVSGHHAQVHGHHPLPDRFGQSALGLESQAAAVLGNFASFSAAKGAIDESVSSQDAQTLDLPMFPQGETQPQARQFMMRPQPMHPQPPAHTMHAQQSTEQQNSSMEASNVENRQTTNTRLTGMQELPTQQQQRVIIIPQGQVPSLAAPSDNQLLNSSSTISPGNEQHPPKHQQPRPQLRNPKAPQGEIISVR